ncbi:hypothetical protein jhhlp_000041 [Lomentospora prolificans]|uniref:Aminotransferase class V domain-containing protein n=1 Tax=Lomentospora prolificans TaxID=41688 RepID=A0A2N3NLF4_9PEZI|nr:hypothetical protein jhhlp_000041 [Lomentospora prolificans]
MLREWISKIYLKSTIPSSARALGKTSPSIPNGTSPPQNQLHISSDSETSHANPKKRNELQDLTEARPDSFIRYQYPKLLDENRAAVAKLVNAPLETIAFVTNATVGVNTVFRNLKWNSDGKDVVINFSTIYGACGKVIDYMTDFYDGLVSSKEIPLTYPVEDDAIIQKFRDAVKEIEADGKRPRIVVMDVVSSLPGVRFPWEKLVPVCRELGVLSMVDGAQGIGMVSLDLSAVDPDFFVSNCHKWLHVPRGSAVFYVPVRNQHLIATTLATSHGYVPRKANRMNPLPPSSKSPYVTNFEFVGTMDNSPYLCMVDAIAWRQDVLGGEEKVLAYLWDLNKTGSKLIAERLGTQVLDNSTGTLTNCSMANVALPIWVGQPGPKAKDTDTVLTAEESAKSFQWILNTLMHDYNTFLALFIHDGRYYARVSAQVYLDLDDYEYGAKALQDVCARVAKKEFL